MIAAGQLRQLKVAVFGLSLSSSWGNGHATTYRALLKALHARGHDIVFFECDVPWYAEHRDLPSPSFCRLVLYRELRDIESSIADIITADIVIIGSYVPRAIEVFKLLRPIVGKLAFYDIDTPITLSALAMNEAEYLDRESIPNYDLYLSFTAGPVLDRLEREFGTPRARALFCSVDPTLYKPAGFSATRWSLGYLGTYSSDRQEALDRLLLEPARKRPDLRFVVAGPQYPDDIAWPDNVDRINHLPPSEHARFYNSLAWTLNVTRSDMIIAGYSPSVRLFEAAACGTPVISDLWPGLGTFFKLGEEIATASTTEDILDLLAWPEAARQSLGMAGRSRILREHTADVRAELLEAYIHAL